MLSLRWITWSIPGTGLTTLVTDLFAERISECELVRLHKSWLIIFPAKTSRLVDRGFAFCTIYYPNLNIAFVPAFMRGRSQMSQWRLSTHVECHRIDTRYTCEVVFSRVNSLNSLFWLTVLIVRYITLKSLKTSVSQQPTQNKQVLRINISI